MRIVEAQTSQVQSAIRMAGLDPRSLDPIANSGTGGPLVPATGRDGLFENLTIRTEASVARLGRLRRSVRGLPFGEPIKGELDLSSGFGYRIDPFTRSLAVHTGLDFKAETGAPVHATGAGRVVTADYSGAYGNLVEIEHGNGVTSRYGHLSVITVSVGQAVKLGSPIGRVGSTGRSTGPHLHYETRLEGEAIDPQRFLRAGAQIEATVALTD
jgi:murein DD-endopeptidase MepM/ murein hydrolase activator NlpD